KRNAAAAARRRRVPRNSVRSAASRTTPDMSDEPRRARAAWALYDAAGRCAQQGNAEAVIDDVGLSVGTNHVAFVDADGFSAAEYRIELELWPAGRLVLTELGRRFDTFR